jgi:hypothetical protein
MGRPKPTTTEALQHELLRKQAEDAEVLIPYIRATNGCWVLPAVAVLLFTGRPLEIADESITLAAATVAASRVLGDVDTFRARIRISAGGTWRQTWMRELVQQASAAFHCAPATHAEKVCRGVGWMQLMLEVGPNVDARLRPMVLQPCVQVAAEVEPASC